jgi:hypothetical protein
VYMRDESEGGRRCSCGEKFTTCGERAKALGSELLPPPNVVDELEPDVNLTRAQIPIQSPLQRARASHDDEKEEEIPRSQPEARAAMVLLLRARLRRSEDSHIAPEGEAFQMRQVRSPSEHGWRSALHTALTLQRRLTRIT